MYRDCITLAIYSDSWATMDTISEPGIRGTSFRATPQSIKIINQSRTCKRLPWLLCVLHSCFYPTIKKGDIIYALLYNSEYQETFYNISILPIYIIHVTRYYIQCRIEHLVDILSYYAQNEHVMIQRVRYNLLLNIHNFTVKHLLF